MLCKKSNRFTNTFASLVLSSFVLAMTTNVHAGETVCANNGGAGYLIPDEDSINLTVPFNFGDISVLHDLNVETDIVHTFPGDLTLRTTSPDSGTQITIFERPGTAAPEFTPPNGSCGLGPAADIDAIFDDESANPPIENEPCLGVPAFSGDYKPHDPAPNNLSAYDGENPNGDWSIYLSDSASTDTGTLNEICLTVEFAGVIFDKWVSTNPTCSDTTDNLNVSPGTPVYYCYTVSNPSTETFTINPGDTSDSQGHDISALQGTYAAGVSNTTIVGPLIAGTDIPMNGSPIVNIAQVIATFATPNINRQLTTDETATLTITQPDFITSIKTVIDVNGGSADPGDILQYTITINESAGVLTNNLQLDDIVDSNLENITITTLPAGAIDNTTGNNINITGINVPASGSISIVFEARIVAGTAAGTNIDNTATLSQTTFGINVDIIAPTVIVSVAELSTSTKSVLDVNGTPSLVGDVLRYTITINETGGRAATNVTLNDSVDSNLTAVSIVGALPPGAVNNSVGNNINITNISIPANDSVSITFDATISNSAGVGSVINNTAIITDTTTGLITNPSSGAITVGSAPASGNKQLYVNNIVGLMGDLTRIAPTNNTISQRFVINQFVEIDQTPVFQSPFTITGGSTINAFLNVRQTNGAAERTVQVELFNGNTGSFIGTASQSFNVPNAAFQYLTFQFPVVSDIAFNNGDFIRLRVTNITTPVPPLNRQNIQVATLNGGNVSQIQMQTNTVINIDSIGVFAAAYPDTTQFPSYAPGSTVFIRSTVSDPFGSADITGSNLTITDAASTVQLNNIAMTEVDTPTGATKVFEHQYTIPASPQGIWRLDITASEGFEGTVTHSAQSPMIVGTTVLEIAKTSSVISDQVNAANPKTIPGSIVEYTISVKNNGFGFADNNSIIINDPLPANTRLFFGSPLNPATFIDGIIPSGLNFNFSSLSSTADDIAFSNNGGVSTITPSVDANGFDITVPPINHIQLLPKGTLRGSSDGINTPSFDLKFRVRVE